jgi:uncharacterized membrane protein
MYGLYNIPILGFSLVSLVYFSLQLQAGDTAYKLATIGGNLCLFPVLVYMTFDTARIWMNEQFGRAIVYICVLYTLGFAFSLYSLYHFSRKLYVKKDAPEQNIILDGFGVAGSLATVLSLLPMAPANLLFTLSIPVGIVYFWYRDLVRAWKKK